MKSSKLRSLALSISLFAFLLVVPSPTNLSALDNQDFTGHPSYPTKIIRTQNIFADIDGDTLVEQLVYKNERLDVLSMGNVLWTSPSDWTITKAEITDLNRDQSPEVALLVWRAFAPWPIDAYIPHPGRIENHHNQENRSCHLILIGFHHGEFQEIWAGSALADPILDFTVGDLSHDGHQELIALEGQYDDPIFASLSIALWEWNGFGFSLLSRNALGFLPSLAIFQTPIGRELLLAQGIFRR